MGRRNLGMLPRPTVHSRTGMARLRLCGREFWLGTAGSPQAEARYTQLIAAWAASGGRSVAIPEPQQQPPAAPPPQFPAVVVEVAPATPVIATPPTLTVGSLVLRYLATVKGTRSAAELRGVSKWWNVRLVNNALASRRAMPIDSFGPKALKDVMHELATRPRVQKRDGESVPRTRYMVNRIVKEIVRMFEWGVSEELVSPERLRALECVQPLQAGELPVRESDKREGVADADVEKILPHLPPVVADLVRFARLTAVRPSEACRLRLVDVEFSPTLPAPKWTLDKHKNAHRGKLREVAIGPRAQAIIERWANGKAATDPVFSVSDLGRAKVAGTIKKRKRRTSRAEFTTTDIRKDIRAACKAAGVPHWTPYQLRHAGIGEARQKFGAEGAQAHAGHATLRMVDHYAEVSFDKKSEVALRIG